MLINLGIYGQLDLETGELNSVNYTCLLEAILDEAVRCETAITSGLRLVPFSQVRRILMMDVMRCWSIKGEDVPSRIMPRIAKEGVEAEYDAILEGESDILFEATTYSGREMNMTEAEAFFEFVQANRTLPPHVPSELKQILISEIMDILNKSTDIVQLVEDFRVVMEEMDQELGWDVWTEVTEDIDRLYRKFREGRKEATEKKRGWVRINPTLEINVGTYESRVKGQSSLFSYILAENNLLLTRNLMARLDEELTVAGVAFKTLKKAMLVELMDPSTSFRQFRDFSETDLRAGAIIMNAANESLQELKERYPSAHFSFMPPDITFFSLKPISPMFIRLLITRIERSKDLPDLFFNIGKAYHLGVEGEIRYLRGKVKEYVLNSFYRQNPHLRKTAREKGYGKGWFGESKRHSEARKA